MHFSDFKRTSTRSHLKKIRLQNVTLGFQQKMIHKVLITKRSTLIQMHTKLTRIRLWVKKNVMNTKDLFGVTRKTRPN
jgi:hypothetical protein